MFGRVPFAFYIVHWFLLHALSLVLGAVQGVPVTAAHGRSRRSIRPSYGLSLAGVYVVWLLVDRRRCIRCALDGRRQDAQPRLVAQLRVNGDIPDLLANRVSVPDC